MTPSPREALAAALLLSETDYAVFPCRDSKLPACPHGLHDASTDPGDIKDLWRCHPGPLVGVACGLASHVSVLDIDQGGRDWYARHRTRLSRTRVHRTRKGGLHFIYGDPDGLPNSVAKIAPGIDVRGQGGYIVWWPAAGLKVVSDAPIAPWPDWLWDVIMKPAAPPNIRQTDRPIRPYGSDVSRSAAGLIRTVAHAPQGQRNASLFWAANRARDMIAAREIDGRDAVTLLGALERAAISAGLSPTEVRNTVKSALREAS